MLVATSIPEPDPWTSKWIANAFSAGSPAAIHEATHAAAEPPNPGFCFPNISDSLNQLFVLAKPNKMEFVSQLIPSE